MNHRRDGAYRSRLAVGRRTGNSRPCRNTTKKGCNNVSDQANCRLILFAISTVLFTRTCRRGPQRTIAIQWHLTWQGKCRRQQVTG